MIEYWEKYHEKMIQLTIEHLQLVGGSLTIAIIISGSILLFCLYSQRLTNILVYFFSLIYSIPSLAMFALLIPLTGLGESTAMIALVIYCQYILLRSFVTGIMEVDPMMIEVAFGMGMTRNQVLRKIQLPLAANSMFAGIRVAATSTIGIATIAATINAGGLGTLLFDGLRTMNTIKLAWGTLLLGAICLVVNLLLLILEWFVAKKIN